MAATNSIFTGASRFTADFQAVIDRGVAIASLPLLQIQSIKQNLQDQSSALTSLGGAFVSLRDALQTLENATGSSSFRTSVSNGAVVSAVLGEGAVAGTYSLEVTRLGSWSTTLSKEGLPRITNPAIQNISANATFTLTVGGETRTVTPASQSLNGLVEAINNSGIGIEAVAVNVGMSSNPDYRLSLRSTKLGPMNIELRDDTTDLLDAPNLGETAAYKLNGLSQEFTSDTRTLQLAPGLTVSLLQESTPGSAAVITVTRSPAAAADALTIFANAYNRAVEALDHHRGTAGGALAGQSVVQTLSQTLRDLVQFSQPGAISSMNDLGLFFDDQGKLALNSEVFNNKTPNGMNDLLSFLGSSGSGGFLKTASGALSAILNETNGIVGAGLTSLQDQISRQDDRIYAEQERIEQLRENMISNIMAADALIASLEQQVLYINGLFESMRIGSQTYN